MCCWNLTEEELIEIKLGKEIGLQTIHSNIVKLYNIGALLIYKQGKTLRYQMVHYPHYDYSVPGYCMKELNNAMLERGDKCAKLE